MYIDELTLVSDHMLSIHIHTVHKLLLVPFHFLPFHAGFYTLPKPGGDESVSTVVRLTAQSDQSAIVLCHAGTDSVTETTSTIPRVNTCGVGCIIGRYCLLDIVCF